jgi:thiol-disulfide isomerase/thioredoxin
VSNDLEIVFVSLDHERTSFDECFQAMRWKALPFEGKTTNSTKQYGRIVSACSFRDRRHLSRADRRRAALVADKFNVDTLPRLIVVSRTRHIVTLNGVDEIKCDPIRALRHWSQGSPLFWSRPARDNEFVWHAITCRQCFLSPLLGTRHGCANEQCQFDLCDDCLSSTRASAHEHVLVEYLVPRRSYPVGRLLSSVPYLLDPRQHDDNDGKSIEQRAMNNIGFYFAAYWCPSSRALTPRLAELYAQLQDKSRSFEIIFVSCDQDRPSFDTHRSEMPWPAVPLHYGALLKAYVQLSGRSSAISNRRHALVACPSNDRCSLQERRRWSSCPPTARFYLVVLAWISRVTVFKHCERGNKVRDSFGRRPISTNGGTWPVIDVKWRRSSAADIRAPLVTTTIFVRCVNSTGTNIH